MRWAVLQDLLHGNGQMIPLDPPFFDCATVGGVISANCSGPLRRSFGTARDLVIGMTFATLEGKLVQTGGMVVKNVAGLDMAKLMIGSFGTLAAITSVNFKVIPRPSGTRTFLFRCTDAAAAFSARDQLLKGVTQPAAIDLVNPAAADRIGLKGYCLLVQANGHESVLDRYAREFSKAVCLSGEEAGWLWTAVREFVPRFVADYPRSSVLRFSTSLTGLAGLFQTHKEAMLSRAGSGVTWLCREDAGGRGAETGSVVEFAPADMKKSLELWPRPTGSFEVMKRVKSLFDPKGLLNPGRLYGHI